jgi:hypothetical protein
MATGAFSGVGAGIMPPAERAPVFHVFRTECWPTGVPLILENTTMQIIQQPDKITILYSETYEVRHVRMNQPHPAQVIPSWNGDSIGHYEGDTLVIDTVGVKVGPFPTPDLYAMVDLFGTPHTLALHVVERYRIGYSIMKRRKRSRNMMRRTILPSIWWTTALLAIPTIRGRDCNWN